MRTLFVLRQMVSLNEALATHIASVAFACVTTRMGLQIVALSEAFRALRALVRALAGMDAHVNDQIVSPLETLSAHCAMVPFLAGMIPFVHLEIGGPWKSFRTILAFVGSLAFVASHVHHQVVVTHKRQTTFGAKILFLIRMSFDVFA